MLEKFRNAFEASIRKEENRIYLQPHQLLRPYIAHYTIYYPDDHGAEKLQIIPDGSGCIVAVFNQAKAESFFLGASTETMAVKNAKAPPHFFIEFRPGGAFRFFNFNHAELRDQRIPLELCMQSLEREILNMVEKEENIYDLTACLDSMFLRLMNQRPDFHPAVKAILAEEKFWVSVKELSENLCYSQRHLNRLMREQMGIGLKTYLNIVRINKILGQVSDGGKSILEIAAGNHFYDQAHFNHEFQRICKVSPLEYLNNMSIFYNEPLKF